jgi:hypothetical protein
MAPQPPSFRIDIDQLQRCGHLILRATLMLLIRGAGNAISLPFILDTGADFTTIGKKTAKAAGIAFNQGRRVVLQGVTGPLRKARLAPVQYSFHDLPNLVFASHFLVVKEVLELPLLSLRDIHPHFTLTTTANDEIVFTLRDDHKGRQSP